MQIQQSTSRNPHIFSGNITTAGEIELKIQGWGTDLKSTARQNLCLCRKSYIVRHATSSDYPAAGHPNSPASRADLNILHIFVTYRLCTVHILPWSGGCSSIKHHLLMWNCTLGQCKKMVFPVVSNLFLQMAFGLFLLYPYSGRLSASAWKSTQFLLCSTVTLYPNKLYFTPVSHLVYVL